MLDDRCRRCRAWMSDKKEPAVYRSFPSSTERRFVEGSAILMGDLKGRRGRRAGSVSRYTSEALGGFAYLHMQLSGMYIGSCPMILWVRRDTGTGGYTDDG